MSILHGAAPTDNRRGRVTHRTVERDARQRALDRAHREGVRALRMRHSADTWAATSVSRPGEFYLLVVREGRAEHLGVGCEGSERGLVCKHVAIVEEAAVLLVAPQPRLVGAVSSAPVELGGLCEVPSAWRAERCEGRHGEWYALVEVYTGELREFATHAEMASFLRRQEARALAPARTSPRRGRASIFGEGVA